MMDHERTEKELEEIFEEIQHSYKSFMDNLIALQERTLEIARDLIEDSAGEETQGLQATLDDLADQSMSQREQFEKLAHKSSEAYMKVLKAPADHHKVKDAKADLQEASPFQ
jgi:cobalamin biosynthesis protein CobT